MLWFSLSIIHLYWLNTRSKVGQFVGNAFYGLFRIADRIFCQSFIVSAHSLRFYGVYSRIFVCSFKTLVEVLNEEKVFLKRKHTRFLN